MLIGIAMARFRAVDWLLDPFVAIGFPSPKIAFLPVFILWFGIDSLSKILLVASPASFRSSSATYSAARPSIGMLLWSAYSLGTGASRGHPHHPAGLLPAHLRLYARRAAGGADHDVHRRDGRRAAAAWGRR